MPSSVDLGPKLESVVSKLVSKGRYGSKSEVIRAGVRMLEEHEKRLAAFDRSLEKGLEDARTGRSQPMEAVFDELRARFGGQKPPKSRRGAK